MEKYIKELLFEHDCVILPGFGGFLTQYVSAEVHPITHKFTPPSKRLAFNEQLKSNDGLLVTAVALKENIERIEASARVVSYVQELKEQLNRKNLVEIQDIGRVFYNTHDKLEFEPDLSINFFEESYGLPELFFKPIERNFTTMNKPSKAERADKNFVENDPYTAHETTPNNNGLIVFAVLFLILCGATAFFYLNQDNQGLASINPFVLLKDKNEVAVEAPKAVTPPAPVINEAAEETEVAEVPEEPVTEKVITSQTGRFFIIAGSFKKKENAIKLKEKFETEGRSVTLIEPSGAKNNYRVSVADFDSKETALSRLADLKSTYGKSIWILSY